MPTLESLRSSHTIQIDEDQPPGEKERTEIYENLRNETLNLLNGQTFPNFAVNFGTEVEDDEDASREHQRSISFQLPKSIFLDQKEENSERSTFLGWIRHAIFSLYRTVYTNLASLTKKSTYKEYFTSKKFTGTFKAMIVVLVGLLFQLYPPLSDYLGQLSLLAVIPVLLFDMNASYGVAFEYCVLITFMTVVSTVITGFFLWVAFDNGWALSFIILVLTGFFAYMRATLKPRWTISCVVATLMVPVIIIFGKKLPGFSLFFTYTICLNMVIGSSLCFLSNALIFPSSAFLDLKAELSKSTQTMKKIVEETFTLFSLQSEFKDEEKSKLSGLQAQIETHFIRLSSLLDKSSLEPFLSSFAYKDYQKMVKDSKLMLVALKGMINTCQLSPSLLARTPIIKESIQTLTPCMRELNSSLELSLGKLKTKFEDKKNSFTEREVEVSLEERIKLFDKCNEEVVNSLFNSSKKTDTWDDVFFIYFFLFTFREFAIRLQNSLHFLEEKQNPGRILRTPGIFLDFHPFEGFLSIFKSKKIDEKPKKLQSFPKRTKERLRKFFLYISNVIDTDQVRYGLKVGITTWIATLPEWIYPWNIWFKEWRGEWIAITVTLIMTPSFGTSFMASGFRIAGTIIGALWAVITYYSFGLKPWGIFIMFCIFIFPCFNFLYSGRPRAKIAATAILTFTVITVSKYASRDVEGYYQVYQLAVYRCVMITGGVIITLIFDRCLWPVLARTGLRKNLSIVIHDLASFFGKNSSYVLNSRDEKELKEIERIENKIRVDLLRCEGLLTIAANEPHLSEPLNVGALKHVMRCLSTMLERMSYQRMTLQEDWENFVKEKFVASLHHVRKEMTAHVLMRFWVLAESVRSKTPIPQHLPDPIKVRSKLLREFKKLTVLQDPKIREHSFTITRYYAFALASKEVIVELEALLQTVRILVGEEKEVSPGFFDSNIHH